MSDYIADNLYALIAILPMIQKTAEGGMDDMIVTFIFFTIAAIVSRYNLRKRAFDGRE